MSASPKKLHELLSYCIDFAKVMLNDSGDFYPFGAALNDAGKVSAVGGYDGDEKPAPQDIYRLLSEAFTANARDGAICAAALAANVNIPADYQPPAPDGLRVHLESADFSRYIYVPYRLKKQGIFKKTLSVELFEPIAVKIQPSFFAGVQNA